MGNKGGKMKVSKKMETEPTKPEGDGAEPVVATTAEAEVDLDAEKEAQPKEETKDETTKEETKDCGDKDIETALKPAENHTDDKENTGKPEEKKDQKNESIGTMVEKSENEADKVETVAKNTEKQDDETKSKLEEPHVENPTDSKTSEENIPNAEGKEEETISEANVTETKSESEAANPIVAIVSPLPTETADGKPDESIVPVVDTVVSKNDETKEPDTEITDQSNTIETTDATANDDKAAENKTSIVDDSKVAESEKDSSVTVTDESNVNQEVSTTKEMEVKESLPQESVNDKTEEATVPETVPEKVEESEATIATEFKWTGAGDSVEVGGSFNNWGDNVKLDKKDDVFVVSIDLLPGEYTFKYFVDGEWQIDRTQQIKAGEDGAENNILVVTKG